MAGEGQSGIKLDPMEVVSRLEVEKFVTKYLMDGDDWKLWTHPATKAKYTIQMQASTALSQLELESCFKLIEFTSSADYKKSRDGWKPRSKRTEMRLLDLKYLLVKDSSEHIKGFCSFMPTYEDSYAVIYCYEIHLSDELQSTGLGKVLMAHLENIASNIPEVSKLMLTVFMCNEKAVRFYRKLGYETDEYSPPPRTLRNGTKVVADYLILSKPTSK